MKPNVSIDIIDATPHRIRVSSAEVKRKTQRQSAHLDVGEAGMEYGNVTEPLRGSSASSQKSGAGSESLQTGVG